MAGFGIFMSLLYRRGHIDYSFTTNSSSYDSASSNITLSGTEFFCLKVHCLHILYIY
jgi:hypothetical protein